MKIRVVPALVVVFYVVMWVALIYPGYIPFDRIRPFVLGMPFSLFWQVVWIVATVLVLAALFVWERRARSTD